MHIVSPSSTQMRIQCTTGQSKTICWRIWNSAQQFENHIYWFCIFTTGQFDSCLSMSSQRDTTMGQVPDMYQSKYKRLLFQCILRDQLFIFFLCKMSYSAREWRHKKCSFSPSDRGALCVCLKFKVGAFQMNSTQYWSSLNHIGCQWLLIDNEFFVVLLCICVPFCRYLLSSGFARIIRRTQHFDHVHAWHVRCTTAELEICLCKNSANE